MKKLLFIIVISLFLTLSCKEEQTAKDNYKHSYEAVFSNGWWSYTEEFDYWEIKGERVYLFRADSVLLHTEREKFFRSTKRINIPEIDK